MKCLLKPGNGRVFNMAKKKSSWGRLKKRLNGGGEELNKVQHGRVSREIRVQEIQKLKTHPLFNEQLFKKPWFLGYSIKELFTFVENVHYAVKDRIRSNRIDFWKQVSRYRNGTTAGACKELWNELIGKLPEPTMQDSVNTCKQFICYRLGERLKSSHPDWPKSPPKFFDHIEEAASSVLGTSPGISKRGLRKVLSPIGSCILITKTNEEFKSYFVDVVEFLRKHPEAIPLKSMEVYESPDVVNFTLSN